MTNVGTMHWCAPEVWNHAQYDERSDIYSFAVVILEVACNANINTMFGKNRSRSGLPISTS